MKFKQFISVSEQDTTRESMLKIYQMTPKVFVEFLKELRPFINSGKLDLEKIQATEKVDGVAIRFGYFKEKVFIESARSGIQTDPEFFKGPFGEMYRETLKSLQTLFTNDFKNIADKYGDFKIIGEMFYLKDSEIDEDGTVTFIATKYKADSFGKIGSFILFDEMILQGSEFLKTNNEQIRNEIVKLSTDDWTFVKTNKIKLKGQLDLTYTISKEELENVLNNPDELLKPENANLAKNMQERFVKTLEKAINEKGSVFGLNTSKVEGIVLNVKEKLIGASNPEWLNLKNQLFKTRKEIEETKKDWLKSVTGGVTRSKIQELISKNEQEITKKYLSTVNDFKEKIKRIAADFEKNKDKLPRNVAKSQKLFLDDFVDRTNKLDNNFNSFIKFIGI